jgi:tripeptide aminopeptidase
MSSVIQKFLKYVKFDTRADQSSSSVPSSSKQLNLARELVEELRELGLSDVTLDDNGYVMATLPGNIDKSVPTIGFIAHMDTAPDMSGEGVNPQIIENYNGEDIILNKELGVVLSPSDFPELKNYIGKDLITTDGTTLLGADDKAGIAEIMAAVEYLVKHPEIPHGDVKVGFTPDEEIGRGANHFDVEKFNADFAYTMDGGTIGELQYENFNAAGAKITIQGRNVHPGTAKNKMINSALVANEFISMLPQDETPADTSGYEGFYHLTAIKGEVEETELRFIIRDFDKDSFENRKLILENTVKKLNGIYGKELISLEIKDQYFNMREKVEPVKYIVDIAFKAMEESGVTPIVRPIRGGTDGARLSFMGLPTPNIFTGGENYHGKFEYIPTYSMEKAVEVIVKIIEISTNI